MGICRHFLYDTRRRAETVLCIHIAGHYLLSCTALCKRREMTFNSFLKLYVGHREEKNSEEEPEFKYGTRNKQYCNSAQNSGNLWGIFNWTLFMGISVLIFDD